MAAKVRPSNQQLVARLRRRPKAELDFTIHDLHVQEFKKIDCLDCANCCKSTPALLVQKDINRISSHLGMSAGQFMTKFVEMDEDGDFVFNASPCPLLGEDNYCSVYDVRPASCADYPHTTRNRQIRILDLSLENTAVCPAVFRIFEKLNDQMDREHK